MSIKDNIVNNLNKYLDENIHDTQKLEIINSIVNSIDKHVIKYQKYLKKKEIDVNNINEIVDLFFNKYENIFWYIKQFNAYYEYLDGEFNLINSDKILITISGLIPYELFKYKSIIQKLIIKDIKKNSLFKRGNVRTFKLKEKTYKNVKNLFSDIFSNKLNSADKEKSLMYVMAYISKCMTNSNYLGDDYIQLWYGQSSQAFVEIIKSIFFDVIKNYPKKLNCIKFNYNYYDFSKIKLIKFGEINIEDFAKECKEYKESILATFYYLDQLLPNGGCEKILERKTSVINFFNKYKNKDFFLKKLTKENIIEETNGVLYLRDLYNYLNNLFVGLELPEYVFTFNELAEYMNNNYNKFIDQTSMTTILLRKLPQNSNENINDIWVDGKPSVKNGEKVNIICYDNDFTYIKNQNNIEGYVKTENLIFDENDKNLGNIKIKVTDNRANLTFRGIFLKGYNNSEMFSEFSKEQIKKCPHGIIRLKELFEIFKRWYYKKENYVSFPTRNDIVNFMNNIHSDYWDAANNIYKGIKFIDYDKYSYLTDFISSNIKFEENSYIKIDDFYTTFKNWYRTSNEDYLYPDKEDITEYMNTLYTYKKYRGWQNISFTKNINKLSDEEINEIKQEVNKIYYK